MLKGWKTRIFNVAAAIAPVLSLTEVMAIIPPEYMQWYALGVVLVNMWLREVTDTAAGRGS